jgi:hypothetical protein
MVLTALGVIGCSQNALDHGYVLGFQLDSCFSLTIFTAASALACFLADGRRRDPGVYRRCSIASALLAASCLVAVAVYLFIIPDPGSHHGDISSGLPCWTLASGAVMSLLCLLFSRFHDMQEDIDSIV